MITSTGTHYIDDLMETYGVEKGQELFNSLKKNPPPKQVNGKAPVNTVLPQY